VTARFADGMRIGLAGVAPIPRLLDSPDALDEAPPVLVDRAVTARRA